MPGGIDTGPARNGGLLRPLLRLTAALLVGATGLVIAAASPAGAGAIPGTTFCNTNPLAMVSGGEAQPYPSNITVSGLTGSITKVVVTLTDLSHSFPADIDMLLAAPAGTPNLVILSDTGDSTDISDLDLVFDDDAPDPVPSPITSGTFRPTDNDTAQDNPVDLFPSPAPFPPTGATTLATFDGSDPNGTWSLYANDDANGDSGSLAGGWCLTIETQAPTTTALTSNLNPSTLGQSVTFTATVSTGGSPVTDGTVSLTDGGTPLGGPVALAADGTATFTTFSLTAATHTIEAAYSGSPTLQASTATLDQVVSPATTPTTPTTATGAPTTPTSTAADVSAGGAIPATGNDTGPWLLAAAILTAAGLASLTAAARRRRRGIAA